MSWRAPGGSGAPARSAWSGSRSVPHSWPGSGRASRSSWPSSWRTCCATTRCRWSGSAATARATSWCCCRRRAAWTSSSGWRSWPRRSPRPASPSTASRCGSPRSPPGPTSPRPRAGVSCTSGPRPRSRPPPATSTCCRCGGAPTWTARSPRSAPAPPVARAAALLGRLKLPAQILATFVLGIGVPLAAYAALGAVGIDVTGVAYWCVLAALLLTGAAIWVEGFLALDPLRPPDEPSAPYPTATAVIAAYLPNEAATILETVETFRAVDYPGDLQIIVAYNTPTPMARRGRPAGGRAGGPAGRPAQGRGQQLEGAERQRRHEPRPRRVRRHVRRRPPPGPGRVQAGLALAVQRLRRRPGPLRDPQRRRVPGGARPSRSSSRRSTRSATPAARRCTASACSVAPTATGAPTCWPGPGCTGRC